MRLIWESVSMPDDKSPHGVKDGDLIAVTQGLIAAPDFQASRVDRFFGQVQAIAEMRAQSGWKNESSADISVFVQARYPRVAAEPLRGVPVADLDATNEPILGNLFLLNGDASQGFSVPLPSGSPGELLTWLGIQNFSQEPTIIVYRETRRLIERAAGVGLGDATETTRKEIIRDKPPAATEAQLLEGLELFHQHEVITPTICPAGVWLKGGAADYYVGVAPERSIQKQMRTFLNGWFRKSVRAECEDTVRAGRIDIRLLVPGPGGLTYWAIVELKVVKSFVHTPDKKVKPAAITSGQNAEAIAEGLRQAHEFGRDRSVPSYLEVFDMRKDKSGDFQKDPIVVDQFNKLSPKPTLNVRELFGSSSDARKAGAMS
jgi:hypothetical protein